MPLRESCQIVHGNCLSNYQIIGQFGSCYAEMNARMVIAHINVHLTTGKFQMSTPHREHDSEDSRTVTEDHSEDAQPVIPSAFHVSSAFTAGTSASVVVIPQRRWNPVARHPGNEDSHCEVYLISRHIPEVRHERPPTEETLKKRRIDVQHKVSSFMKCRYTIFFLAEKINRYQTDIQIIMTLRKKQRSKNGLPLPFDMTIQISEKYQQQLGKLVQLSNSMNTPEGMAYLSTSSSEQSRKKFMFWRNVLYEIATIIGFKLVVDTHTGRKEKVTGIPPELVNGKKLVFCKIGDHSYEEKELLAEGEAIYATKKIFLKN